MGFFDRIGRSWEFAKTSYMILWHNKKLIVFPILSTLALLAVLASFALPLWFSGTIESWVASAEAAEGAEGQAGPTPAWQRVGFWAIMLAFYFVNYFVIVFFNAGLVACAMKVTTDAVPSVGFGLSAAARRLPQIAGWALVSAIIGVGLKAVESVDDRVGRFVAGLLGMAWSALTYFVVPIIVVEGVGPVSALKRSVGTLKETWGEALVGNFSLGIFGFLIALPLIVVLIVLSYLAVSMQSAAIGIFAVVVAVLGLGLIAAASSAADVIFRTLLFQYATGQSLPDEADPDQFHDAFRPSGAGA